MILLGLLLVVAVIVLIAIAASSGGGAPRLPSPPPPPVGLQPPRRPQLPHQTHSQLPPQTQKRIQKRAPPAAPPAPPVSGEKYIRLRPRIRKRQVTLSPNAKWRVTRRPVLECSCENEDCRKLRAKYGV